MSVASETIWLEICLWPLAPILARENVTDVFINKSGEIWMETLDRPPYREDAPGLDTPSLKRLARQIAANSAQGISRENPLLAASLPSGERVQIIMPPATRQHLAIAIRKHVSTVLHLEDYETIGGRNVASPGSPAPNDFQRDGTGHPSGAVLLRRAVLDRRNILVSGGTSSGKTTLLNALIKVIPDEERLILIEDTPELQVAQPNIVGLLAVRGKLGEADVTPEDLLIASLRMRPDRIVLGEIRGSEALTFLRAINTGHPGSLSTIHADSPSGAIDQLVMLALQAGSRMRWEDIERYIRKTVHIIVQLERRSRRRTISEIYLTQPINSRRQASAE